MRRFTAPADFGYSRHAFDANAIMLLNALIQLGLSEKEAAAYMMLLRIGESPVSSLAKRLGMKRVTAYAVLDSLAERGYVTFRKDGSCRRYMPQDPNCILDDFERKNEELKLKITLAKECVAQLQSFPKKTEMEQKSSAHYYGQEAEEKLLQLIDKEEPVFIVALSDLQDGPLRDLLRTLRQWRTETHLCVTQKDHDYIKKEFGEFCVNEIHLKLNLHVDLIVQEGKVLFVSWDEDLELSVHHDTNYATLLIHLFESSTHSHPLTSKSKSA